MSEPKDPWDEAFRSIIENAEFEIIPVEAAAEDRDLRAHLELQLYGYTDAVRDNRAFLIEHTDPAQLRAEIQREYGLSSDEVIEAYRLCAQRVRHSRYGELDWRE